MDAPTTAAGKPAPGQAPAPEALSWREKMLIWVPLLLAAAVAYLCLT
jgi:hypothetical protein